ncbi:MAG: cyclodeaminase/cyclohydrolase family protein [Candidatus Omnitrophica bacterium]|nr:cyclodeaminase/cyclohydrolase family protein [Candidatus Omnitrophota bacterium]
MHVPLSKFLGQVAQQGSWYGGGTAAALGVGLSAALLEKLAHHPADRKRLKQIRQRSLWLAERDAAVFAGVIAACRTGRRGTFRQALRAAVEVPCRVYEDAQAVRALGRKIQRTIAPRLQSDVRCAMALAEAGQAGAQGFINANLAWLNDRAYALRIRRRLRR